MLLPSRNIIYSTIFAPHPRSLTFFPYPIFYESTQNSIECSTINHEPRSARGDGAARVTKWRAVPLGSTTRPTQYNHFRYHVGSSPIVRAECRVIFIWTLLRRCRLTAEHRWRPYNYAPSRSTNSAFPRFPAFPTFPTFPGHPCHPIWWHHLRFILLSCAYCHLN